MIKLKIKGRKLSVRVKENKKSELWIKVALY